MSTPAFASASDTQEQKARVIELAPDIYGYVADFDPNCGFIVGDDGVLLIDARATPSLARDFIDDIRQVTDKPIKYLFLTHYHAVRVLGASAFGVDAIFATNTTHRWIAERGQADFDSEVSRFPRLFKGVEEVPGLTWPKVTFERELSFHFAGREVRLAFLGRAHTAGDAVCMIPDAGVVFSGDLVENRTGVYAGDGYLQDWMETLERLRALDADTMVPGRGAALEGKRAVNDAIDLTKLFLTAVVSNVKWALGQGYDLRRTFEHTLARMEPDFGDWPIFQHALPFDVARAYDELRGITHPVVWTADRDAKLWADLHGG